MKKKIIKVGNSFSLNRCNVEHCNSHDTTFWAEIISPSLMKTLRRTQKRWSKEIKTQKKLLRFTFDDDWKKLQDSTWAPLILLFASISSCRSGLEWGKQLNKKMENPPGNLMFWIYSLYYTIKGNTRDGMIAIRNKLS